MIPPLLAIFSWPLISAAVFARYPVRIAVVVTVLGGYLLLPERAALHLPGLPDIDKTAITSLSVFLLALVIGGNRAPLPGWLPKSKPVLALILLLPVMAVATVLTNTDTLVYESIMLPGLKLWEAVSVTGNLVILLLPLLVARRHLADPRGQRVLLFGLVAAGLAYSLPAAWEIRMSPQLHNQIYGYFPHNFAQHRRGDGFRPVVFLNHALWLSLFLSTACLAALAMFRTTAAGGRRWLYLLGAAWLCAIVLLSKSFGALVITVLLAPLVLLVPARTQVLAAAVVAGLVITYPLLRGAGLVPTNAILAQVEAIKPNRAASLRYRLNAEDQLLEKVDERPAFGWGRFGRNLVYDEKTGRQAEATDGHWIVRISQSGWLGYIAQFGLLCGPLLLLALRGGRAATDPATAGLAIILAGNLIDLIPNGGLTPVTWLVVGALYGRLEYDRRYGGAAAAAAETGPSDPVPARGGTVYARSWADGDDARAPRAPLTRFGPGAAPAERDPGPAAPAARAADPPRRPGKTRWTRTAGPDSAPGKGTA